MSAPLVSVIIPVHERPRLLVEAVASAVEQDHRPLEVIVVDDGSADETSAVAAGLARRHAPLVQVLVQPRAGAAAARERGRRAARGDYVQYLDSDDLLLPGKLSAQVAGLEAHPECGASYGWTRRYTLGERPRDVAIKRTGQIIDRMFPSFLEERWWSTSTPLFRRSVLDRAGPWADLRAEEDWEYDCRVAALGTRLHHVPRFVSDTRDHAGHQLNRDHGQHPDWLRDRARAHRLIHGHARRGGVAPDGPAMRHFVRALFALARQCGAAGLTAEADALLDLAWHAAPPGSSLDIACYRAGTRLIGQRGAGRLARALDRVRAGLREASR